MGPEFGQLSPSVWLSGASATPVLSSPSSPGLGSGSRLGVAQEAVWGDPAPSCVPDVQKRTCRGP